MAQETSTLRDAIEEVIFDSTLVNGGGRAYAIADDILALLRERLPSSLMDEINAEFGVDNFLFADEFIVRFQRAIDAGLDAAGVGRGDQ